MKKDVTTDSQINSVQLGKHQNLKSVQKYTKRLADVQTQILENITEQFWGGSLPHRGSQDLTMCFPLPGACLRSVSSCVCGRVFLYSSFLPYPFFTLFICPHLSVFIQFIESFNLRFGWGLQMSSYFNGLKYKIQYLLHLKLFSLHIISKAMNRSLDFFSLKHINQFLLLYVPLFISVLGGKAWIYFFTIHTPLTL